MKKGVIVVYDLETGGLSSADHAVTEFAGFAVDKYSLEIIDKCEFLIRPYGMDYTKEAEVVSGITTDLLEKEGVSVEAAVDGIIDFLMEHKQGSVKPILCGHNIKKFDNSFLYSIFDVTDNDLDKYTNVDRCIDTLDWSSLRFVDSARHNLGVACSNAGIILKEAHRAAPDAKANAKLLISMLKNLRGEGSGSKNKKKRVKYEY